jgi:hypothetical protein
LLAGCLGHRPPESSPPRPPPQRVAVDPALAELPAPPAEREASASGPGASAPAGAASRIWTNFIGSHEEYLRYSSPVRGIPFTKFVLAPKTGTVYYFWTAIYPFHYNFVVEVLFPLLGAQKYPDIDTFNKVNHSGWDGDLILGAIGYQNGIHAYEFLESDTPTPEQLRFAHERLGATLRVPDLRYRPLSLRQQELVVLAPEIPWIGTDFVTSGATFQCLNEGRAIGRLQLLPPGADAGKLSFEPGTIVVLDEVPLDIAPVDGILAGQLTSPLSHVNLRATAWGIPNAGQVDARRLATPLDGQVVLYEVHPTSLTLRAASPSEQLELSARLAAKAGPPLVQLPTVDLAFRALPELEGLTPADVVRVGAKAANLGVLATRGSGKHFQVPRGLAVPFVYYQEHLLSHGLHLEVKHLLDRAELGADDARLDRDLQELRRRILEASFDPTLRERLVARARHLFGDQGLFVRSSTNAEDLPNFNGAGLYDTVPNVRGEEQLVRAVKQVWASVWNLRAFRERERWGIDHRGVYPAVIVQVGIDAQAAGVMVTTDVFRPGAKDGVTINAKRGLGIRVVDGMKVPEQVLFDEQHDVLRVISRSDDPVQLHFAPEGGVREEQVVRPAEPVLTEERVRALVAAAREVRTLFPGPAPLDIEWLIAADGLWLVQARPYIRNAR